jgi:peptidoglycan/xylan/chitin deacetylase (PgdA/CDA1 family)
LTMLDYQVAVLCYHYIIDSEHRRRFPRILGVPEEVFKKQVSAVKREYCVAEPEDLLKAVNSINTSIIGKKSVLFTFDDGLSSHLNSAKILAENGIRAIFFIPTCIIIDHEPATPVIIHYLLAIYGIARFIEECKKAAPLFNVKLPELDFPNTKTVWQTIRDIKKLFKYDLDSDKSRKILLTVYKTLMLHQYPDALRHLHLQKNDIKEIVAMGHSIGAHSRTHVSISNTKNCFSKLEQELIHPKNDLEEMFSCDVFSLSYPFGEDRDCLKPDELNRLTSQYSLAFTVKEHWNVNTTPRYQYGRYSVLNDDSVSDLLDKIKI